MSERSPLIQSDPSQLSSPRSHAMRDLVERGYIYQSTNLKGLDAALAGGVVPAYVGFDATADSLHVGHLLPIMALRRLQRAGHKPIVLIGGGTTRIGDPSFRSDARPMLSEEQIAANIAGIRKIFDRFLRVGDGPTDAIVVNNADWFGSLKHIDMLREIGSHFSVNRMLTFDSVRARLEKQESLSFLEFNYMILQAFDFHELNRRFGCRLQLGGADQWGNIVNGIELTRRIAGEEVFGLTSPLLTTASGAKMGKTVGGAVWLNADRLSPYDYWQFWRNTDDADVGRFLRLFTDMPMAEIARVEQLRGAELNAAKVLLANQTTALAHGRPAANAAAATARQTFGRGEAGSGLPVLELSRGDLDAGVSLVDLMMRAGLASSKGDARRSIAGRGVRLDGEIVEEEGLVLEAATLPTRLSLGRKRHVVTRIV